MHLFAYGTLMVPEIWRLVTGREDGGVRAVLPGFCVRRVRDDLYPVMLPCEAGDESANGLVYLGLDRQTWERLDQYESTFYDRVEVEAVLRDRRLVRCQAYILPASRKDYATDDSWDVEWFNEHAIGEYMKRLG